ncbi:hypothetical protein C8J57DRAFT_1094170, partial [Mycena rebaudengoi]
GEYHAKFVPSEGMVCQCGKRFQTREPVLQECESNEEHRGLLRETSTQISLPIILGTEKTIRKLARFLRDTGTFTKTG